jgi:hypothetical protein
MPKPIPLTAGRGSITAIAQRHGLDIETMAKNRAGLITGQLSHLEAAYKEMWSTIGYAPRFITSSSHPNEIAPRIEIHPVVWCR